uniref:Spindle and kinetochore-associated protein 3 isoform X1 n=1 Tax=Pogona vitticeps TaxID=103695 RepID=A0A6J0UC60_9SAUR
MDVTGSFFNKLRTLAATLEKQAEQLKQVFQGDGTELEEDSPMRYLHELHSEVRTLKGDADKTLCISSSERDSTYDFIKASKVLMKRNAANLGELRDMFQKYGYKPVVSKNTATKDEAEINPTSVTIDHEKTKDFVCPGKSSGPYSPQQIPQLSDFGLSKYALPSTTGTMHIEPQGGIQKEGDVSGCLSPKAENFHMHGRDLCLNDETTSLMEDQTIFLLNNAKNIRQNNKLSGSMVISAANKNLDTPKQTNKLCDNDYMASPAAPEFCTPGVKIPHRKKIVLPKSSEGNHMDASDHVTGKSLTESLNLTESQAMKTGHKKITVSPNNCLECIEESCPPAISDYTNLISTPPPPPEITVIPDQIFQILSKYNPKAGAARAVEKQANEGIGTRTERALLLDIGNKENRKYYG